MAEQLVHRPARRHYPPVPPEPETLAAPPVEHDVSALARALGGVGRAARTERKERRRYLDYIRARGKELASRHAETRAAALRSQPDPHHLGEVIRDPERLWERRRTDTDFLHIRVGTGSIPWGDLNLPEETSPIRPFDALMVREARALIEGYASIAEMPGTISLAESRTVTIVGDPVHSMALMRAMVAGLAATHSPDDLQIGIAIGPENLAQAHGIDQLPHLRMNINDGPVAARRIAPDAPSLGILLRGELDERMEASPVPLLVVVDHTHGGQPQIADAAERGERGIILLSLVTNRLHEPSDTDLRLTLSPTGDRVTIEYPGTASAPLVLSPDTLRVDEFAALASQLAPLRLTADSRSDDPGMIDVLPLIGVPDLRTLSPLAWRARSRHDFLRVTIAIDDNGNPVAIDLKESAQGGMGPHGICIGATGSGKSELLRTLVLSLAVSHSPEDLSMILVDYKGGAAFTPFQRLPHVAGLIDNLAEDAQLIGRARASIEGEVIRRQRLLKDAGAFASITDYRNAREENPDMAPMPHLFLVIDEFGELLTAEPEFIDLLLQIGRIGRALGIHLLLASQRIESGRMRGLDTYLSYRIGLRTFSEQESAVILDNPDAFRLPAEPGWGYLKVDTSIYTRFRAGYVSAPVTARADDDAVAWGVFALPPYNTIEQSLTGVNMVDSVSDRRRGPTVIERCVSQLRLEESSTTPVWLPPLPDRLPLFRVLDSYRRDALSVPVGLLDEPKKQAQEPWRLDLARAGGHFAVIGAPQSGRSTFLRTFAAGIATTHTPTQVTMYGLDLTGAGLIRLEAFPHVGGVATRANREQQVRLCEELQAMIAEREQLFRAHHIESLAQFRQAHEEGLLPDVVSPDVVLLVDGYGLTRTDFDYLADPLADILTRGSSFGIHLVLALTRWSELTMRLQPLIGNRIELRLNDPTESTIQRKLAETIRTDQPGRALTDEGLFAQVALPTIEEVDDSQVGEALTELAEQTAQSWNGPAATPIRLLPENLSVDLMPDAFDEPDAIPIGLRQDTMEPALLDLQGADQHVLVLGDARSGKTTVLRQVINALIERYGSEELVIALMEPRGVLVHDVPDDYLGGHATNAIRARQLAASLAVELEKRQNGEAAASLKIVCIVDDYDILSAGGTGPLQPLLPYLASAKDLNLNVFLTRPVAGAARAMFENTIQSIKDTGGTGIILSGERAEGALWPGVHASQAVPGRAKLVRRGHTPRLIQIANRGATDV